MKLPQHLAGLALGFATILAPNASHGGPVEGFEVGNRFPHLVLPSLESGEPLSVSSFRGNKIALHVWASW